MVSRLILDVMLTLAVIAARGDALRSTDQIQSSIRNARSEVRAWGRFKRANRDGPGKWR